MKDNPPRKGAFGYDNEMKKHTIINFLNDYPEFNLINLEDTEFFARFSDGYPIYDEYKKLLNKFEIVHFDGPHDTNSVLKEVEFFIERRPDESVYIFDDISSFNLNYIEDYLIKYNFEKIKQGLKKALYICRK